MKQRRYRWLGVLAVGIAIAIGITFFSPFASGSPDGLERVAEDKGFRDDADGSSYDVIPNYTMPGIENERLARVLSGIVGVLIVAGLGLAIGYGPRWLRRRAEDGNGDGSLSSSGAGPGAGS